MSSQDPNKLVGKLVKMEGPISWLAHERSHIVGCIVFAELIEGDMHVWVHWADGGQTWERLKEDYIVLVGC